MSTRADTKIDLLKGLLNRTQLAAELKVSTRTVIRFEEKGLPVIRLGAQRLYDPEAVRKWVRGQ